LVYRRRDDLETCFLLTGKPRIGKSTAIKRIIQKVRQDKGTVWNKILSSGWRKSRVDPFSGVFFIFGRGL